MANKDLDWEGMEPPGSQTDREEVGYLRDADADDEEFGESDDLDEDEGDMADEGTGRRG
jgi:hypothetical protein